MSDLIDINFAIREKDGMTQEQIDSIRERMCDAYCRFPRLPVTNALDLICEDCPLNELEVEE